jgi:hypothetical protein
MKGNSQTTAGAMHPFALLLLSLWIGSQSLQVFSGIQALRERSDSNRPKRLGSLYLSGVASILPFATLLLFLRVFVIGGSSNVAQLAGASGSELWGLWFHAWPLLFFGCPLAFVAAAVATILPPYPPGHGHSFVSRVGALVSSGCAWYVVVTCFPDA